MLIKTHNAMLIMRRVFIETYVIPCLLKHLWCHVYYA